MKFGQLIDSMRNIFLKKSYTKCGRKTIPLTQCSPPPPLLLGGPEKFSILAKRGELALFEFLGGSE